MKRSRHPMPYVLCMMVAVHLDASAMSSTSQVASEGQLMPEALVEAYGWPAGVLDLVNDPLRSNGWNPWFSGLPNDVHHYEIKLTNKQDLEKIIQKLSAIRCDGVRIQLDPGRDPGALGLSTVLPKGNNTGALFSIGSQKVIDQWFLRLPKTEPGVREFGAQRYTESPKAFPPTLTLFVGHDAIDLENLQIPAQIEVCAKVSDAYREEHKDDPIVTAIDAFIMVHRKKRAALPEGSDAVQVLENATWLKAEAVWKEFAAEYHAATRFAFPREKLLASALPTKQLSVDGAVKTVLSSGMLVRGIMARLVLAGVDDPKLKSGVEKMSMRDLDWEELKKNDEKAGAILRSIFQDDLVQPTKKE